MTLTRSRMLKLILIPIVLVLGLELLLQLGAKIVAATVRDIPTGWNTQHIRVLALGDSNTFGIYLQENESYPAQLEKFWNERNPERPIEVLNLGYPGTNSFRIAETLDEVLRTFKPEVVLLTVGVNDMFTASEYIHAHEKVDSAFWDPVTFIQRYSRVYKLFYMTAQGLEARDSVSSSTDNEVGITEEDSVKSRDRLQWTDDPDERMGQVINFKLANSDKTRAAAQPDELITVGGKKIVMISGEESSNPAREKGMLYLQGNVKSIEQRIVESGAKFYLLTYAASQKPYEQSNKLLRGLAATNPGIDFIDVATRLQVDCPVSSDCPDLFFGDLHPTAKGYAKVAKIVAEELEQEQAFPR
jgi:lysophospholipase L1-like esterase